MANDPSEQVKRVYGIMQTLEQKSADVKRLQQDMNQMVLALGEAQKAQANARVQLAVELKKLDPGIIDAMSENLLRDQRKAS